MLYLGVESGWIPSSTVEVSNPGQAYTLLKLISALNDLDDVQTCNGQF